MPASTSAPHVQFITSPPEWGPPLRIWNVDRLWQLAEDLPTVEIPLEKIPDLERVGWYGGAENCGRLTIREIADHARRIREADLSHPVLLSAGGYLFDGLHRVAKAWMEGHTHILAKQFPVDPEPDKVQPMPSWLTSLCLKRLQESAHQPQA